MNLEIGVVTLMILHRWQSLCDQQPAWGAGTVQLMQLCYMPFVLRLTIVVGVQYLDLIRDRWDYKLWRVYGLCQVNIPTS